MNAQPRAGRGISFVTAFGLFIALFGILIVRQAISWRWPIITFTAAVWKESLIWICAITLLVIIRRGEGLPLRSIGIGTSTLKKSLIWGGVLAMVCGLIGGALVALTRYKGGPTGESFSRLPVWLITLIVVRAGVVEELFYRGYAIERLQALGLNCYWAAGVSLTIFAVAHWTGGLVNIVIALALGVVLSASYLWRRDLVANVIGHFMVDFLANVLPRFFS